MATEVNIQPTAKNELEGIVEYLSAFGSGTAAAFLDEWDMVLNRLREGVIEYALSRFPVLACLGYRPVLIRGYVMLCFIEEDTAVIAHVFHQSQDYTNIIVNGIE